MGLWSIKEVSEYLGIKQKTLYAWTSQGKIPYLKIHGLLRFQKEKIDAWLDLSQKEISQLPPIKFTDKKLENVDTLIEKVKQGAYNATCGETRPESAQRKEK